MNMKHTYRLLGITLGIVTGSIVGYALSLWHISAAQSIGWLVVALSVGIGALSSHMQADNER